MAEEKATSEGTGLPAGQASEKPLGSTAVAEANIDHKAIYTLPTGQKVLGSELMQQINRGAGYSKLQSEVDKLKAQYEQTLAYARQLEQEKTDREEKERFQKTYEEFSQLSRKSTANEGDYGLNGEEEFAGAIDGNEVWKRIDERMDAFEGNFTKKNQAIIQDMITEAIGNILQQQEAANQVNMVAGNLDKIDRDNLTATYSYYAESNPTESQKIFDQLVILERAIRKEDDDARRKAQVGDPDWQSHLFKKRDSELEVGKLRGQLHVENEKAKMEAESKGVLGNTLGSLARQVSEKLPRFKNQREREEHHAKTLAEAKKTTDAYLTANKIR